MRRRHLLRSLRGAMGAPGWEHDMPESYRAEWAVRRHLDRIDVVLRIPDGEPGRLSFVGRSEVRRPALWVHDISPKAGESDSAFMDRAGDLFKTLAMVQPVSRQNLDDLLHYGTLLNIEELFPPS